MKWKGVSYDKDGKITECKFCTILESKQDEVIYEDQFVAVFLPRVKSADYHYLIVPKIHLRNIFYLDESHIDLLKRMISVAQTSLNIHGHERFESFHQTQQHSHKTLSHSSPLSNETTTSSPLSNESTTSSPFSIDDSPSSTFLHNETNQRLLFHVPPFHSVDHLHLHALAGRYAGWKQRLKFSSQGPWCVSFDSIINRLEAKNILPLQV